MTLSRVPSQFVSEGRPWSYTPTGLSFADSVTFEEWASVGDALRQMERSVMWWIGDWVRFGEAKWGEKYSQAIDATGYAYGTLANARWVSDAFDFSDRSEKLSWTHHSMAASLPATERAEVLSRAESEGWSVRDVRAEVNRRKNCIGAPPSVSTCTTADLENLTRRGLKFGTVYADPPWLYGNQGTRGATSDHYGGMTVEEIAAMPVRGLAADDAILHLWTTNAFLFDAKAIMDAWGFEYKSCFVWVKPQMGMGNYWRVSHEFLLCGVRGQGRFADDAHNIKSWGEFDRRAHSEKPEQIRALIERTSPGPYLELFGRKTSPGWVTFGNQIQRHIFDQDVEALK